MNVFEQAFRKAVRYLTAMSYAHDRRRRQRQIAAALPTIHTRGEQIRIAIKQHKRCKHLIREQRREMLQALRENRNASQRVHH